MGNVLVFKLVLAVLEVDEVQIKGMLTSMKVRSRR